MTLEETLIKMREKNTDDKFYPLIESLKRRAEKGLIEGFTSKDIDLLLEKIEKDKKHQKEVEINLSNELFEINESLEKYGELEFDSWSEEELETAILYEFSSDIEILNEKMKDDELYSDYEERINKRNKGINIGTGTAIGSYIGAKGIQSLGNKTASKIANNAAGSYTSTLIDGNGKATEAGMEFIRNHLGTNPSDAAEAGKLLITNADTLQSKFGDYIKNKTLAQNGGKIGLGLKQVGAGIAPIGKAIAAPFKAMTNITANPVLGSVGLGLTAAGLAGAGFLTYKLIQHLRRKRAQKLSESFLTIENLFSLNAYTFLYETINSLNENEILFLKENGCDDTKEIIEMFKKQNQALDESVTFIDNAGNLKTMSTENYVKDQHEYHTETQIKNYKNKKKKIDYKLISEKIDIDRIKKLSEMSFEEILNEET